MMRLAHDYLADRILGALRSTKPLCSIKEISTLTNDKFDFPLSAGGNLEG
jgi:hypothetical protein